MAASVLIVDDDLQRVGAITRLLAVAADLLVKTGWSERSFSVTSVDHLFSDGGAAHMLKEGFDFAFVSLSLGGADEIGALEVIVAHRGNHDTVICAVAAASSAQMIRRCYTAGADGFIARSMGDRETIDAIVALARNRFWMPADLLGGSAAT